MGIRTADQKRKKNKLMSLKEHKKLLLLRTTIKP